MTALKTKNARSDSPAEAAFYASKSLPAMYRDTLQITPMALTLPLFAPVRLAPARDEQTGKRLEVPRIDETWHRKGQGYLRCIGPRLTQSHQTVFFALVKQRAGQPVENVVEFAPSELLTKMGWSDNKRNISRLRELLDDLFEVRLRVWREGEAEEESALRIHFLAEFEPSRDNKWRVSMSERLLPLFFGNKSFVSMATRASLAEGLQTFLYGYVKANSCVLPFSYAELAEAAGTTMSAKDFKGKVLAALDAMQDKGAIEGYAQVRGGVRIVKARSAAESN